VGELREAVNRGEALWVDGLHDSRNQLLHPVAGVKQVGKLPTGNQTALLQQTGLYGAASLATLGQPTQFELTGGQAQALFTQIPGNQSPVPAIVANQYGQGNSLLFAFDLAAMLTADPTQADPQLKAFLTTSASYAASATPTLTIGDLTLLQTTVTNPGTRAVALQVQASLPAGLTSTAATPPAQIAIQSDGSAQASWTFTLAAGASQELNWQVRALQAGNYSVPIDIYSLPSAGSSAPPQLRQSASIAVQVMAAQTLIEQAQAQVNALQPSASSDKANKTKAQNAVSQAIALYAQASYEQAIAQWLQAADALIAIASADTSGARQAVSLALEAATDALCLQRCGQAACQ